MPDDTLRIVVRSHDSLLLKKINDASDILLIQDHKISFFWGIPEDYWSHAILPLVIPILIFFLGFLLSKIINKLDILTDFKKKQDFLFTWIDLVGPPIIAQSDAFKNLASKAKNIDMPVESFPYHTLFIDKLQYIDAPTLTSMFIFNKKGKLISNTELLFNLEHSIDFLKSKNDNALGLIDLYTDYLKDSSLEFDKKTELLDRKIEKIAENKSGNAKVKEFINSYWKVLKPDNLIFSDLKDKYLKGLIELCNNWLAEEDTSDVRSILAALIDIYEWLKWKEINHNRYSDYFSDASDELKEGYEDLVAVKEELTKHKFRFFLFLK